MKEKINKIEKDLKNIKTQLKKIQNHPILGYYCKKCNGYDHYLDNHENYLRMGGARKKNVM